MNMYSITIGKIHEVISVKPCPLRYADIVYILVTINISQRNYHHKRAKS